MSDQAKRYRAFISYSQKDKAWARRIHRALEVYRLPAGIEVEGVDAKARKLGRFFRDDDEMGAATNLGAALQGAIADAENLIVVCSPNAANSHWVNEEIIHFKRTGRADRIFAVIVGGEPTPERRERACFPPALQFELGPDGALSDRPSEPLGLDVRKDSFGRLIARLAAGLVRTPFDALWKREQRRKRTRAIAVSVSVAAAALLFGAVVTQSIWRPELYRYSHYARFAHHDLRSAAPGTAFMDCDQRSVDCPMMVVIPGALAVSRYEITGSNWDACVAAGGCDGYQPVDDIWNDSSVDGLLPHPMSGAPVTNVSFYDARNYADWLSRMTGENYRLLSDSEWERAARAGSTAQYSWGDDPPSCEPGRRNGAAFHINDHYLCGQTQRPLGVGAFAANAFGLYDMQGNVWEWVQDGSGECEVIARACRAYIRGGSWDSPAEDLRLTSRQQPAPTVRVNTIGFRIARVL